MDKHQKRSRSDFQGHIAQLYQHHLQFCSDHNAHHFLSSDYLEWAPSAKLSFFQVDDLLRYLHDNFGSTVMGKCNWKVMKWWHLCPSSTLVLTPSSCTEIFWDFLAGRRGGSNVMPKWYRSTCATYSTRNPPFTTWLRNKTTTKKHQNKKSRYWPTTGTGVPLPRIHLVLFYANEKGVNYPARRFNRLEISEAVCSAFF